MSKLVDQYLEAFFALEKRLSMSDVWSCEDPRPREAALKHGEREHEKLLQKFKGRRVEVDLGNGYTASDVVFEDGSALTDDTQRRARYHAAQAMSRPETPKMRYDRKNRVLIPLNLNRRTDGDILQAVEGKAKQTEIKRLIRLALKQEQEQDE